MQFTVHAAAFNYHNRAPQTIQTSLSIFTNQLTNYYYNYFHLLSKISSGQTGSLNDKL